MPNKYLFYAGCLILIALTAATALYRAEAVTARAKLSQALAERDSILAENTKQAAAISRLRVLDAQKDALLADITNQLATIHADTQQTSLSLKALETSNETVRDYMAVSLPDDLQRLLNKR